MAKPVKHYGQWRIRWTDENGKRQSETIDDHRAAAHKLREHEVRVEEIRRGVRQANPLDKTFDALADYWLEKRAPLKRSRKDDESIIRKHLRPAFGALKLRQIGTEDGDRYVIDKMQLDDEKDYGDSRPIGEKTIANHLTLLTTMMNVATTFNVPWLLHVPKFRKPKVALFGLDYSYLRTADEIRRFLVAAREEGEHVFALYATGLYTGMRAGELAALTWGDVDLDNRRITVQRSFDGPTKSDRVRYVPVLDALLPILRAWRLRHPGSLVFTNRDGAMHRESGRIFQEVLHRVLDRACFPKTTIGGRERRHIVFHGLRHTFASHWVMGGGDIFKLQRILGHQSVTMTQRYAHLAPDAFAADYGRLGSGLVTGAASVVPLRAGAE
jgi:integrase